MPDEIDWNVVKRIAERYQVRGDGPLIGSYAITDVSALSRAFLALLLREERARAGLRGLLDLVEMSEMTCHDLPTHEAVLDGFIENVDCLPALPLPEAVRKALGGA